MKNWFLLSAWIFLFFALVLQHDAFAITNSYSFSSSSISVEQGQTSSLNLVAVKTKDSGSNTELYVQIFRPEGSKIDGSNPFFTAIKVNNIDVLSETNFSTYIFFPVVADTYYTSSISIPVTFSIKQSAPAGIYNIRLVSMYESETPLATAQLIVTSTQSSNSGGSAGGGGSGGGEGAPGGISSPSKSPPSIKGPKLVVTKLLTSYNPSHIKSGTFVTDIYATIKNIGDAKGTGFFSPTAGLSSSIKTPPVTSNSFILSYDPSKQITLDPGEEKIIIWKNFKFHAPDLDKAVLFFIIVGDVDVFFALLPSENVEYQESPDLVTNKDGTLELPDYSVNEKVPFPDILPDPEQTTKSKEKSSDSSQQKPIPEKSGCLIATATYGTELASQVQLLREVRDNVLFSTGSGTTFMAGFNQFYYSFSPAVADLERQSPLFREVVKTTIMPMLSTLSILNYVDIDSEQEMLGYGIGIILLNIGMYFVIPALVILKIRSRFS